MVVQKLSEGRARLSWQGAPGGSQDWVSIAPVGMADTNHIGQWRYATTASGSVELGPLQQGVYEVQFYLKDGDDVVSRMTFTMP
jgi:hypothetical protein